jgi:hypothetical protein
LEFIGPDIEMRSYNEKEKISVDIWESVWEVKG